MTLHTQYVQHAYMCTYSRLLVECTEIVSEELHGRHKWDTRTIDNFYCSLQ